MLLRVFIFFLLFQELLEKLESRVLDLSVKAESQLHHLKRLERTFKEETELLKKMTETCREYDHSADADCVQVIAYMKHFFLKKWQKKKDFFTF